MSYLQLNWQVLNSTYPERHAEYHFSPNGIVCWKSRGERDAKGMSGLDEKEHNNSTLHPIYNIVTLFVTSLAGDDYAQ